MGRRHGRRYNGQRRDDGYPAAVDGCPSVDASALSRPSISQARSPKNDPERGHRCNDHYTQRNRRKRPPTRRKMHTSIVYAVVTGCITVNYFFLSQASTNNKEDPLFRWSHRKMKSLQSKMATTDEEHFIRTGKLPGHTQRSGKDPANSGTSKRGSAETSKRGSAELPPLSSLVDANGNIATGADISRLLDFSVVGFPKTGTTSILRHLSDLTISLPKEHCELVVNNTAELVKEIYADHTRRLKQSRGGDAAESQLRGIKCPQDISSDWSMPNYAKHFPDTKLIVGVRHPIFWFESLYNFRVSNVPWKEILPTSKLTKGCPPGSQGVCAWRANFHDFLARLGKTPMTSPAELKLLSLNLEAVRSRVGPVFMYDLSQLSEAKFRRDLRDFLGLDKDIPPFPAVDTSGRFDHITGVKEQTSKKKIDICSPEHEAIRAALMEKARSASVWIRDFFLKSKEVFVSDRPYFEDILKSWMNDPCG